MKIKPPHWVQDAIFYHIFPDRFYNGNSENDPQNIRKWGQKPTRNSFFGGDLEGIIYKFHQRCIQIRKQSSALRKGSFQTLLKGKGVYSFIRKREEETIIVIMNSTLNSEEIYINLSEKGVKGNQFLDLLSGQKYFLQKGKIQILLPKTSGVILANNYVL